MLAVSQDTSKFLQNCCQEVPSDNTLTPSNNQFLALPSFWGQSYLQEDFYLNLLETEGEAPPVLVEAYDKFMAGEDPDLDIIEYINEIGVCYAVPVLGPVPTGSGLGPVNGPIGMLICAVLTVISELIYKSETLRCLLMGLSKATRDTLCFLADIEGVPNPDVLGLPNVRRGLAEDPKVQEIAKRRKLSDGSIALTGDEMLDVYSVTGAGSPLALLGITEELITTTLWENFDCDSNSDNELCIQLEAQSGVRRKLSGDGFEIRPDGDELGSGGLIALVADFVDTIAQSNQAFRLGTYLLDLGWFSKCVDTVGAAGPTGSILCGIIYTLEKTEDAIFCEDNKLCDIETECDANQKIQTEYTSRRIARALPNLDGDGTDGVFNFFVADVIAPCASCDNQCASFCWYQQNYHQCDDYKRTWLYLVGGSFDSTNEVGEFYNQDILAFYGDLFGIGI